MAKLPKNFKRQSWSIFPPQDQVKLLDSLNKTNEQQQCCVKNQHQGQAMPLENFFNFFLNVLKLSANLFSISFNSSFSVGCFSLEFYYHGVFVLCYVANEKVSSLATASKLFVLSA